MPNDPKCFLVDVERPGLGWEGQSSSSLRCRDTQPVRKHFPLPNFVPLKGKEKGERGKNLSTHNTDSCFVSCMSPLYRKPGLFQHHPNDEHAVFSEGLWLSTMSWERDFRGGILKQHFLIIKAALQERGRECCPAHGWGP